MIQPSEFHIFIVVLLFNPHHDIVVGMLPGYLPAAMAGVSLKCGEKYHASQVQKEMHA